MMMSSYAKNKLLVVFQLPNISVDIAKCGAIFHKFIQYTHFCRLQKMTGPDGTIYSW